MTEPLLKLEGVQTHIGHYHILHGVDFTVPQNETTMLLGRNGAGKTTTLRSIMGLWNQVDGVISFKGENIARMSTPKIACKGIAYVPEDMGIFAHLTVKENMVLAARSGDFDPKRLDWVFNFFEPIKRFWNSPRTFPEPAMRGAAFMEGKLNHCHARAISATGTRQRKAPRQPMNGVSAPVITSASA